MCNLIDLSHKWRNCDGQMSWSEHLQNCDPCGMFLVCSGLDIPKGGTVSELVTGWWAAEAHWGEWKVKASLSSTMPKKELLYCSANCWQSQSWLWEKGVRPHSASELATYSVVLQSCSTVRVPMLIPVPSLQRQYDALGNVLLWNLMSCHSCGCYFDMFYLPKYCCWSSTPIMATGYFLMAVVSFCRMLCPTSVQKWLKNGWWTWNNWRYWLDLQIPQMPIWLSICGMHWTNKYN